MRGTFVTGLTVFSVFWTVVLSAGPLVRPKLNTTALMSACGGSSQALCTLPIRNTKTFLVLSDLQHENNRDEAMIAQIMSVAIRTAVGRGHGTHELMGIQHRRWSARSGTAVRSIWALDLSPSERMTWAMWVHALLELEQFTQNNPQWNCLFSVQLDNNAGQRTVVGTGGLGPSPWVRVEEVK